MLYNLPILYMARLSSQVAKVGRDDVGDKFLSYTIYTDHLTFVN